MDTFSSSADAVVSGDASGDDVKGDVILVPERDRACPEELTGRPSIDGRSMDDRSMDGRSSNSGGGPWRLTREVEA